MRSVLRVLALWMVLLTLPVAALAAFPMTVKDARGKEVRISRKPMRIVSLTPGNTEILFAVGLADRVVGVTKYCDYPAEAEKKTKIGDMTVNTETVVALKPDLVLAHAVLNDSVIPRLEKLGLTVFAIDPSTISEVARDIRTVGKITARPKTADSVAKDMEQAVAAVKAGSRGKTPRKAMVVIQSNPLWVAGPETFVDEMMSNAGGKNIAFDARPGFVTFSRELAVSRNPDVILVGLKSDADFFLKSAAWKNCKAVKNKRVYVLDYDTLVRPGPRLAAGLRSLASKLNY